MKHFSSNKSCSLIKTPLFCFVLFCLSLLFHLYYDIFIISCGRLNNGLSLRCPCPNSWDLCIYYLMSQKGHRRCDCIKDLETGRLSWISQIDTSWSLESLKEENLSQLSSKSDRDVTTEEWAARCHLTGCKYGRRDRKYKAASRRWKGNEVDSPLESSEGTLLHWHLDSRPLRPILNLCSPEL